MQAVAEQAAAQAAEQAAEQAAAQAAEQLQSIFTAIEAGRFEEATDLIPLHKECLNTSRIS